ENRLERGLFVDADRREREPEVTVGDLAEGDPSGHALQPALICGVEALRNERGPVAETNQDDERDVKPRFVAGHATRYRRGRQPGNRLRLGRTRRAAPIRLQRLGARRLRSFRGTWG